MDKFIKINSVDEDIRKNAADNFIEVYTWNGEHRANGTSADMKKFKKYLSDREILFDDILPLDINFELNELASVLDILEEIGLTMSFRVQGLVTADKVQDLREFGARLELENEVMK